MTTRYPHFLEAAKVQCEWCAAGWPAYLDGTTRVHLNRYKETNVLPQFGIVVCKSAGLWKAMGECIRYSDPYAVVWDGKGPPNTESGEPEFMEKYKREHRS